MWPNQRFLDLIGIDLPIIQAPMAGFTSAAMVVATSEAGGLGSLPCALLGADNIRTEINVIRQQTSKPININFFCHTLATSNTNRNNLWKQELAPYFEEYGLDISVPVKPFNRDPFDDAKCTVVEDLKPNVVSFHFGLPEPALLARVKAAGCVVLCSATTAEEAQWLEAHGCDAIIAQGVEAGGHRGMFLTDDIAAQAGTMALTPQIVDAVSVPVIAAGGIADGRGIAAAFALGASAVQMGTAYLFTSEARVSSLHKTALKSARDDQTALTNLFSGKPARSLINRVMRELGPISDKPTAFPTASAALTPLKEKAEAEGKDDFTPLWSGQAASLGREMDSGELTRTLAEEATQRLNKMASVG